jgi:hypothetical protein
MAETIEDAARPQKMLNSPLAETCAMLFALFTEHFLREFLQFLCLLIIVVWVGLLFAIHV